MKTPGDNRERVNSARLILEYTKAKPASKSELAISKAEDFLASLVDTEEENDDGQEASPST